MLAPKVIYLNFKSNSSIEFLKLINSNFFLGFLPVEQSYISCKGTAPYLRGYPCSIWLLFHSLTVQEYLKLTNNTQQSNKKNFTLPSHTVLRSMKNYVQHFFPCTSCVEVFENDMNNLERELVNLNSSILWLWREHNKLNLKLKEKSNDDPEWPKIIFPTFETCQKCYLKEPVELESINDLNKISWNETEVVDFLINHYKKESMIKSAAILNNLSIFLLTLVIIRSLLNSRLSNRSI